MLESNRGFHWKIAVRRALLAGASLLWLFPLSACGKKGPPVPPGYVEPAASSDLRYEIKGTSVVLRWTVTRPSAEGGVQRAASAKIYRSKETAADAACTDCPLMFSLVEAIPCESDEMTYTETLEPGRRYAFKVVLVDSSGRESADSNVVRFESF